MVTSKLFASFFQNFGRHMRVCRSICSCASYTCCARAPFLRTRDQEPLDGTFRAPGQLRAFFKQRQSPDWSRDLQQRTLREG